MFLQGLHYKNNIILSVIQLNIVMLNVIMLNVMAPKNNAEHVTKSMKANNMPLSPTRRRYKSQAKAVAFFNN